ncbi:hypothetical protein NQ317_003648 [Molorchus minor]|uniref:Prominin-like protein n=1 Tax=Molorchus minor TaxID=1323400 RepID=A0ABQ9JHM6_9CUCU|nr:hypothetical protein NQ317_003648 [Molorchus minor]
MGRRKTKPASQAQNNRLSVNIVSFLMTCVVLVVSVGLSDGGFANSIDKITRNLDVALRDLMDDMPKYTNYTETRTFVSDATFNPRGMAGLYNLTKMFLDVVIPPDALMEGLVYVRKQGDITIDQSKTTDVLKFYWPLLLMVLILALMAVLTPVCFVCFMCCRCCGNCGARSQPCDKKRDLCKKILQGAVLIVLTTGLLFCVVCAFVSNQQLEDGFEDLPEHGGKAVKDVNAYMDSLKSQSTHLLDTNYKEFSVVFNSTMNKSSEYVSQQLEIWSNATAMMDLYAFVDNIPKIKSSLKTLKSDTNSLRTYASQLNDAMRKVKKDLLNTLNSCDIDECKDIKNNISQLQTNIDFNKLPDVSPTINKIEELDFTSLQQATAQGKEKLTNIEVQIKEQLSDTIENAITKVNEAGETIKTTLSNITSGITSFQNDLNRFVNNSIPEPWQVIKKIGSVSVFIIFFVGLAADRIICYPLKNPQDSEIANIIDGYIVANVGDASVKENKTAYIILNAYLKQFDVDSIHDRFDILSFLEEMNKQLEGVISKDFTILSPDNEQTLEELTTFDLSINFDQFRDELKQNFTNLSLNEISKQLEKLLAAIGDDPKFDDIKSDVHISILHVNTYDEKILTPMKELANKVIDNAQQLDLDLRMNSSSFSEAITKLLSEIKEAQEKLRENGTEILQTVANEFGHMVKRQVDSYLYRVGNVTKYELGQCGPLNVAINSTRIAVCDKVVLPLNGFGFSIFLSLLLFLLNCRRCIRSINNMDHTLKLDINVEKRRQKKSKQYEERPPNVGGEVVAREYTQTSHPPEARYADMAPKFNTADQSKHWEEFPNGGPPQYQRAPTEYERPPPYYYPGTGDQQ